MRVLLLLDTYADDEAGMMVFRLCQRWAPMREMVLQTMAVGEGGPLMEELRAMGISSQVVPASGPRALPRFMDAARRLIARGDRPDVVQAHGAWPQFPARLLHAKFPHVPLVSVVSSFPRPRRTPGNVALGLIDRLSRRYAGAVVPVSAEMEKRVLAAAVPAAQVHRISLGVDAVQTFPLSPTNRLRYRTLLGVEPGTPLAVYTEAAEGGEAPHLEEFLAVAERVKAQRPEVRFFIIGAHFQTPRAQALIAARGLAAEVRAVGPLSAVMAKVYSTADVVVRRTQPHVFPFAVAEAMATATPVLALVDASWLPLAEDARTGGFTLARPDDFLSRAVLAPYPSQAPAAERAATVLLRLLGDPALREHLGQQAREHLQDSHELNATAHAFVSLWRRLAPDADFRTTDSFRIEDLEEIKKDAAS